MGWTHDQRAVRRSNGLPRGTRTSAATALRFLSGVLFGVSSGVLSGVLTVALSEVFAGAASAAPPRAEVVEVHDRVGVHYPRGDCPHAVFEGNARGFE